MMRPYPGRYLPGINNIYLCGFIEFIIFLICRRQSNFNYRLSRARRVIENTFGILAARWRIFRRPILADPVNAIAYTKAAIVLHNYLRTHESLNYCPPGFVDGEDGSGNLVQGTWRENGPPAGILTISHHGSNRLFYILFKYK